MSCLKFHNPYLIIQPNSLFLLKVLENFDKMKHYHDIEKTKFEIFDNLNLKLKKQNLL